MTTDSPRNSPAPTTAWTPEHEQKPRLGLLLWILHVDIGGDSARCSAAPAADPGPRGRLVAPAQDHPPEADKEMSTVVHGTVSIGWLGMQLGKAHLLRGEVDTCKIRHDGIRPLVVGSKTSLNITFNTHLR